MHDHRLRSGQRLRAGHVLASGPFLGPFVRLGLRESTIEIDRKLCERMQMSSSFHTIAPPMPFSRSTESVTMATMKFSARRLIIAGGFAVAVAAAPAVAFVATPAPSASPLAQCPGGEENDLYTSMCVPHLVPNAGEPYRRSAATPT